MLSIPLIRMVTDPVKQALRRQPEKYLLEIDNQVKTMLKQGIIEPAQSAWSSNVVMARKKDGSLRFCVDYRKLNELTVKDTYPLPLIQSCLGEVGKAKWFSTFDLRSGYHQVVMERKDADKTTFITRRGTYRFRVLPFGLCNAPATFQRLMDVAMSGLNLEICLVYLDDIILFSDTVEQHMERLEQLFQHLDQTNLKLKPSKCKLFQTEVLFLGHRLSADGLTTDPEKTRTIQEWPTPKNLKEVRSFLGLCSYYRRFVQGFSEIASPLHELTKKKHRFGWTPECEDSFRLESCRANELMLVERQRIQIDPRGVERQPAERKRVPAGDRYVERELLDVPKIGRAGSHSIEHRTPNRQIMGERSEDDYIYIYPSDDDNPNRTITRVVGRRRSPSFTRTDERYKTITTPRQRRENSTGPSPVR